MAQKFLLSWYFKMLTGNKKITIDRNKDNNYSKITLRTYDAIDASSQ